MAYRIWVELTNNANSDVVMLPFLKKQTDASSSNPIESVKREPDEGAEDYDSLESAVSDLFEAYKSNDLKAGAAALRAAFELCDAQPHVEGEHI